MCTNASLCISMHGMKWARANGTESNETDLTHPFAIARSMMKLASTEYGVGTKIGDVPK